MGRRIVLRGGRGERRSRMRREIGRRGMKGEDEEFCRMTTVTSSRHLIYM